MKSILKALQQDRGERFQDAGVMGYDLEYFLYHKGYGPTIQTLQRYQCELFPELYTIEGKPAKRAADAPGDLSISLSILGDSKGKS